MVPERRWVAVDVDLRMVRGVVAGVTGRRLSVVTWAEIPRPGPCDRLGEAVGRLLELLGARGLPAVLVLPRRLYLERLLVAPRVLGRHLSLLLRQELEAALPWRGEDRCDGVIGLLAARAGSVPAPGSGTARLPGGMTRFLAVSVRKKQLEHIFAALTAGGARPRGAVPVGVALANVGPARSGGAGLLASARDEVDLVHVNEHGPESSRAVARGDLEQELCCLRAREPGLALTPLPLYLPPGWRIPAHLGFRCLTWRAAGAGELPPAYWAAWGALVTAAGRPEWPLLLSRESSPDSPLLTTPGRGRPAAGAVALLLALLLVLAAAIGFPFRRGPSRPARPETAGAGARLERDERGELAGQ